MAGGEIVAVLAAEGAARVERIVSPPGFASPSGFWYDQAWPEWVAVLAGSADLLLWGETQPRRLGPGDHILVPARCRHRIEWTDSRAPTIWLAVHFGNPPTAQAPD